MSDGRWASVRFVPGSATALVGRGFVALIDSPPTHGLVKSWQELIESESTMVTESLLASLGQGSLSQLPALALVLWKGEQVRILVRGNVAAEVANPAERGGGLHEISGQGLLTWTEQVCDEVGQVRLSVANADEVDFEGTLYTASLGVLPAVGVELLRPTVVSRPDPRVKHDPEPLREEPDVAPADDRLPGSDRGGRSDELHPESPPVKVASPEVNESSDPEASPPDVGADPASMNPDVDSKVPDDPGDPRQTIYNLPGASEADAASGPDARAFPPIGPPPDVDDDPGPIGLTGNYDDLFGSTMIRSVEEAAVRVGAHDDDNGTDVGGSIGASHEDIDPAHDGMTIAASELRKLRGPQGEAPPLSGAAAVGPSVLAVSCPAGHGNAPHAMSCRVCGVPLDQQSPTMIPRPVIGKFVFDSGEEVLVDRTILIGRSPKLTGQVPDGHAPELVKVDSPSKDVSRTHLEVRIEGWSILAVDLNSANGTMVTSPGRPAQRLRPGEPFMLSIGATVRLADEVDFRLEAPG